MDDGLGPFGDDTDRAAESADDAAHRRDAAAEARDDIARRTETQRNGAVDPTNELQRCLAATDRAAAAADRLRARLDRLRSRVEREQAAAAHRWACTDTETGLLRREGGLLELQRRRRRPSRSESPMVFALVEIDHLRPTHTENEHTIADAALIAVARTVATHTRFDDTVMRYSATQIVIAASEITLANMRERMTAVAAELFARHSIRVSFGLAHGPVDEPVESIIVRADASLRTHKTTTPLTIRRDNSEGTCNMSSIPVDDRHTDDG